MSLVGRCLPVSCRCEYFALNLLFLGIRAVLSKRSNSAMANILHRPIRAFSFPESSNMGLFLALSVPLEDPYNSVSMSYFFEANYALPANSTYLEDWTGRRDAGRRRRKSIDRRTMYRALQRKFHSSGYPGRACMLRAICETSEYPLTHNGLIGDILHVILTPTSSRDEELPWDVVQAELHGRNATCRQYRQYCPLGLFDLIGILA